MAGRPNEPARVAAQLAGAMRYASVKPCKHSATPERYTVSTGCTCAKKPKQRRADNIKAGEQMRKHFGYRKCPLREELSAYERGDNAKARSAYLDSKLFKVK